MKLVWDDDETAGGFPVVTLTPSYNDAGKIISVVAVGWFGQDNAFANQMNQDLVDGLQSVVASWSDEKLGNKTPGLKKP